MRSFGRCRYRVSPIIPLSQQLYCKDFDFHSFSSPGLTEVEDDTSDGVLAIRLIIGRDFAVTRSAPEFRILFLSIEVVLGRFFVCPSVVCPLKPRGFLCLCACVPLCLVCWLRVLAGRWTLVCLGAAAVALLKRGTCRILDRHAVSVTSLCVSGLVSEAVKYDETMKSKWFSQNIDSGVCILSAQTGLQHCVSTLVVICTRSG